MTTPTPYALPSVTAQPPMLVFETGTTTQAAQNILVQESQATQAPPSNTPVSVCTY